MTQPIRPDASDLMAQLAAARSEVAAAAAKSRALRQQMQAESLAQAAALAQERGDHAEAGALADDAERQRREGLNLKV